MATGGSACRPASASSAPARARRSPSSPTTCGAITASCSIPRACTRRPAPGPIRKQVGKGRVICGLSGGVDSAVAAVLIHEAIGEQLPCIFVDHGLLRHAEAEGVVDLFRDHYNIPLVHRDASELFLGKLAGVSDPEQKRKTIGGLFIDVFE